MVSMMRMVGRGAAAGAAGTTALNAVTYVDMVVRGRPPSSTPDRTVEEVAARVGVSIPGRGTRRSNRVSALGALGGLLTGVGSGIGLAVVLAAGPRRNPLAVGGIATVAALLGGNGPMIALGVSDPRDWSAADWVADLAPHLAYGAVTGWVLARLGAADVLVELKSDQGDLADAGEARRCSPSVQGYRAE